jgi:glycosyltransferase involved in cell wall biosynthesis
MRVGMISTPFIPVPPTGYGGTELIVHELCEGLRARGHQVVLYTCGPARGLPPHARVFYEEPVWPPDPYREMHHAAWAIADLAASDEPVDVIHSHCPAALPLARFAHAPLVHTIHHERLDGRASYYAVQDGVRYVAISARQRSLHAEIADRADVVLHGLDAARYPLGRGGPDAFFLGRLAAEKGPHLAIGAARAARVRLVLAGKPHDGDEPYFESRVKPLLGLPGIEWIGEADFARKLPLLRNARATLFPIEWEEPFGLVMIESMLCGTPVLALPRG